MKSGNWIPISKGLAGELPTDRPFSKLEAMFSLTLDYDQDKQATINGYAALWKWSRSKIRPFLDEIGISIEYPENTSGKQNQKGQIRRQITDRSESKKGQINFIDSKCLQNDRDRYSQEKVQIKDRSLDSTINPINPNPKNLSEFFEKLWKAYPKRDGKKAAGRFWPARRHI